MSRRSVSARWRAFSATAIRKKAAARARRRVRCRAPPCSRVRPEAGSRSRRTRRAPGARECRRQGVQTVDVQGGRLEIGERANDPPGLIPEPELAVRFVKPETRRFRKSGELSPRERGGIAHDMDGNPDVDFSAKAIEFPCLGQSGRRIGNGRKSSDRRGSSLYRGSELGQLLLIRDAPAV